MSSSYSASSPTASVANSLTMPENFPESIEMKELTTDGKPRQQKKSARSSAVITNTNKTDRSVQRVVVPLFHMRPRTQLYWTIAQQQQTGKAYPPNTI